MHKCGAILWNVISFLHRGYERPQCKLMAMLLSFSSNLLVV
jgi:hypothetical protein